MSKYKKAQVRRLHRNIAQVRQAKNYSDREREDMIMIYRNEIDRLEGRIYPSQINDRP